MADPTLNLVGGRGEKPRQRDDDAPKGFVYDPSAEDIADMAYDTLLDVYSAMAEYDASRRKGPPKAHARTRQPRGNS